MNDSGLTELLARIEYCSFRFSWLRPNLLMTGPGSAGMSFLMDWAEQLSALETVFTPTHQTTTTESVPIESVPDFDDASDDDWAGPDLIECTNDSSVAG